MGIYCLTKLPHPEILPKPEIPMLLVILCTLPAGLIALARNPTDPADVIGPAAIAMVLSFCWKFGSRRWRRS